MTIDGPERSAIDRWKAANRPVPWEDVRDLPRSRRHSDPFAEFDFLGRKVPHRPGLPFWLLFVARLDPGRVRRVPASAIAHDGEDDLGAFADVACPCGSRPVVRAELAKCGACERYYTLVGHGVVFVAYGAMSPPPLSGGSRSTAVPVTTPS